MKTLLTLIAVALMAVVALALLIQLVPYGRQHTNPPLVAEPNWNSPQTRELARRACFDCHSNDTSWPVYSNIAPLSWLVQRDVDEGRRHLNFSEWGQKPFRTGEIGEAIREGEMPPFYYVLMHRNASLTAVEKDALIQGLNATLSATGGGN